VPTSTSVTTVVMTRNRREELLRSLAHHDRPVIVVDNGSEDDTAGAVARRYPEVQLIEAGRNLGAVARNLGVEAATTPYVAFADDDSWWAPGATGQAAALLDAHSTLAIVVGHVLVGPDERPDPFNNVLARSPLPPAREVPGVPVLGFMACAAFVRRTAYLSVGGFDPVVEFGGEEARLAIDVTAAGWLIQYVPDLIVHHHPSSRRVSARAQHRRGVRNSLLTMVMRRPWTRVGTKAIRDLTSFPDGTLGVVSALPRLPAAIQRRSPVDTDLESKLMLLESPHPGTTNERTEPSR
jgi:GT2 family glycosyltransferase